MRKDLTTTENTDVALSKSKSFMGVIKNIFNNKITVEDGSWMQRLWDWADENDITDLELPRNKEKLLASRGFNFSEHKLKKLPKEIGNLIGLTDLDLWNNELIELPKEIGNLTNLTELYLHDNSLVGLPKEICNLINLTKLYLGGNQLTELSGEVCGITSLTLLNLKYSQLLELSKEIENLTNLTELNLGHNQLVELPREISNLISLTALQLEGNLLTGLPEEIGSLISLLFLDLGGNQLLEIPKEIGGLNNLKILYLSNNKLMELPREIVNLTNLSSLGLNANPYLMLTKTQKKWLLELEENGCNIYIDNDIWEREIYDDLSDQQGNINDSIAEKNPQYEEPMPDSNIEEGVFQLTKLLEKEATSREAVLEFILGELDGASQGNEYAINFVKNSGFESNEYMGALTNASDEADAIHLALHSALFGIDDIDLRVRLSTSVLDNMMKKYSLGKYSEDEEIPF